MARLDELIGAGGAAKLAAQGPGTRGGPGAAGLPTAAPPDEMLRLTAAVLALLQRMPGVLPLQVATEVLAFLANVVTWMNDSRCQGRRAAGGAGQAFRTSALCALAAPAETRRC
jgi:hypothetical protein